MEAMVEVRKSKQSVERQYKVQIENLYDQLDQKNSLISAQQARLDELLSKNLSQLDSESILGSLAKSEMIKGSVKTNNDSP